jgi:hypothetical protein
MINVVDVGDGVHCYVVLDSVSIRRFYRDSPLAGFGAQQGDFARFLIVYNQRVRICDHVYGRCLAGADVVDYVALTRIQGERHLRNSAGVCKQQARTKYEHADKCD